MNWLDKITIMIEKDMEIKHQSGFIGILLD